MAGMEMGRYGDQGDYQQDPEYGQDYSGEDYGPGPAHGQGYDDYDDGEDHPDGGSFADYKQYTEDRHGPLDRIDPDNGIAPRRCTDCICLIIFIGYMLGMIILVLSCRNGSMNDQSWSDIRRLTHGHDYAGRLCGVDAEVADRPFLYFCRTRWSEYGPEATQLNLEYPSCVSHCPTAANGTDGTAHSIKCLFNLTFNEMSITPKPDEEENSVEPFGTLATFHVQFQQSEAETNPYDTIPFSGRFCVPKNESVRQQVVQGPLRYQRPFSVVGSLQDCWLVLGEAAVISIALGYVYLFLIFKMTRIFTVTFLYGTWVLLAVSGGFFMWSVFAYIADRSGNPSLLETFHFATYTEYNPLFEVHSPESATLISVVVGAFLWCLSCGVVGTLTHVAGHGFMYVPELIDAANDCVNSMKSMWAPPGIEGVIKFLLFWMLGYNFMYIVSVGWLDDERLVVNGVRYKNATAVYYFDTSIIPWIVFYLFGAVWLVEFVTTCGQFLISFSVISWYFTKNEGEDRDDSDAPPMPAVHGLIHGAMYHAGSLCLGAAIIPWVRLIRLLNWIEDESVPDEEARCFPEGQEHGLAKCTNALCGAIGRCCSVFTGWRKRCSPDCCRASPDPSHGIRRDGFFNAGCSYRYSKNAYNDVIIRSQHYLEASNRAFRLVYKNQAAKEFLLNGKGCQVVTVVGVSSIGLLGMLYTHFSITGNGAYIDPTSSSYIAEPLAIDALAFLLCANIAYGFMALFDHGADTLLYCYAWSKKFAQDNPSFPAEDYLPEKLQDIVDEYAVEEDDDKVALYGRAKDEMYLHKWFKKGDGKATSSGMQAKSTGAQSSPMASQVNPMASGVSGVSRQFPAMTPGGSQAPYQSLPQAAR
mmetsp:Transcript_99399/g.207061  ORF Transcript_99399/g.207061 Transcript_99399/m.207061 type:complete len:866 (-) Transcript_99399:179-2776(-)